MCVCVCVCEREREREREREETGNGKRVIMFAHSRVCVSMRKNINTNEYN